MESLSPVTSLLTEDRLIFIHFEKTAGTSANRALKKLFAPAEICPETSAAIALWPTDTLERFRYFSAHAELRDFDAVPRPAKIVTFLRDPVERSLSLYEFWASHTSAFIEQHNLHYPRLARSLSVEAFFSEENHWRCKAANHYSERLLGDSSRRDRAALADPAGRAARAIERLDQLDFVGISEDLGTSFDRLSAALDIPNSYADEWDNETNKNHGVRPEVHDPVGFDDISQAALDAVVHLNQADQIIYDHAVRRFYGAAVPARTIKGVPGLAQLCTMRRTRTHTWIENRTGGFLLTGPRIRLRPGRYSVTFDCQLRSPQEDAAWPDIVGFVDVVAHNAALVLAHQPIPRGTLADRFTVEVIFDLARMVNDIEFRFVAAGQVPIDVSQVVTLRHAAAQPVAPPAIVTVPPTSEAQV